MSFRLITPILAPGMPGIRTGACRKPAVGHLDLDFLVVQQPVAQLLAEGFARRRAGVRADQRVENALFGVLFRLGLDFLAFALAHQR
jgi:hypothetical protein